MNFVIASRLARLALCCVAPAALLASCGGGDPPDQTQEAQAPRQQALSVGHGRESADERDTDDDPRRPARQESVGASGVGDPYFPLAGNDGYDVQHYRIALTYDAPTHGIATATTEITAVATQALSRFNLDLSGLVVDEVRVEGRKAAWSRSESELTISPARPLKKGQRFTATVRYHGTPVPVVQPYRNNESAVGWLRSPDGAVVMSEATGAQSWFPANDHPSDKATFTFEITVPDHLSVVANGEPDGRVRRAAGMRTETWRMRTPMATYLAMLAIGQYEMIRSTGPNGLPLISAVPTGKTEAWKAATERYGEILAWTQEVFGPYPFASAGGVVSTAGIPNLETQSRPIYGPDLLSPDIDAVRIILHETAHQWFGDSITPRTWRDTWLNEGFATFAEKLWAEREGSFRHRVADLACIDPSFWIGKVADPGPGRMLDLQLVYERASWVLVALRERIGDLTFATLLHRCTAQYGGRNASTADFVELAQEVSGLDLHTFSLQWLYSEAPPVEVPACTDNPPAANAADAATS